MNHIKALIGKRTCTSGTVTELRERKCSILVISHLLFEQKRFDKVYNLQEGKTGSGTGSAFRLKITHNYVIESIPAVRMKEQYIMLTKIKDARPPRG